MRDQIEKIIEILTKTESDIQKVIVEAAQTGDYRSVDMARNAAVNIKNLQAQISDTNNKVKSKSVKGEKRINRKVAQRKGAQIGYPKFQIKKDTLIRIGWSKKQRREYIHKVPCKVFDLTIETMIALAKNGAGPFTAEQIIDKVNDIVVDAIPAYQVYVVIAMLRKANCIKQMGREGYHIPIDVNDTAQEAWRKLSK